MRTPEDKKKTVVVGPNFLASWFVYDYVLCATQDELQKSLDNINLHGYDLVSVTQDLSGIYSVFFRRRACG